MRSPDTRLRGHDDLLSAFPAEDGASCGIPSASTTATANVSTGSQSASRRHLVVLIIDQTATEGGSKWQAFHTSRLAHWAITPSRDAPLNGYRNIMKRTMLSSLIRQPLDLLVFGIMLLLILILLPVSNYGHHSMRAWGDQSLILTAFHQLLNKQTPDSVADGWLGPGYLFLAYIVKYLFALSPENALIWLNRLSYIGTVLVLYSSGYLLLARHTATYFPALISFTYTVFLTIGSIFFGFSDIPWTHFIATFLVVSILFITLFKISTITIYNLLLSFLQGCLVCLLTQVRFHDSLIFLSCYILFYIFIKYFQLIHRTLIYTTILIQIAVFLVGFLVTLFLVHHLNNLHEVSFN